MSDKNNPETSKEETEKAAAMIWDFVLLCMGSFTVKTIWNVSIRRMFPSAPFMYFLDGIGVLMLVYIVARTASMGFMTESIRVVARGLETASSFLKKLSEELGVNKVKVNVRNNEQARSDDDSSLN